MNEDCQDLFVQMRERIEKLEASMESVWTHLEFVEMQREKMKKEIRRLQNE